MIHDSFIKNVNVLSEITVIVIKKKWQFSNKNSFCMQ